MKKQAWSSVCHLLVFFLIAAAVMVEAQECKASGILRGKKPPPGLDCIKCNCVDLCIEDKLYPTYNCSPLVSHHTIAVLTLHSFDKGGGSNGGEPSASDNINFHSDDPPVVALSTGWFNNSNRCHHNITIHGNGRSVDALVVDECDSTMGCDNDHDYRPPCDNNVVSASRSVWKALGVPVSYWGWLEIYWSDA